MHAFDMVCNSLLAGSVDIVTALLPHVRDVAAFLEAWPSVQRLLESFLRYVAFLFAVAAGEFGMLLLQSLHMVVLGKHLQAQQPCTCAGESGRCAGRLHPRHSFVNFRLVQLQHCPAAGSFPDHLTQQFCAHHSSPLRAIRSPGAP